MENNLLVGLRNVFGEAGAATPFDVVKADSDDGDALSLILSCPDHLAKKLRTAITLQGSYQGKRCAYHVIAEGRDMLQMMEQVTDDTA